MSSPKPSKPGRAAARGDLVVLETTSTAVFLRGGRRERTVFEVGVVTSVTRDGWVKALRLANGTERRATGAHFTGTRIGPAAELAVPVERVLALVAGILGDADLETLGEVRAVLQAFSREVRVTRWGNACGWDVGPHRVVIGPHGVLEALIVDLPEGAVGAARAIAKAPAPEAPPTVESLRALVLAAFEAGAGLDPEAPPA